MDKLRLLLTLECPRNCSKCCNKMPENVELIGNAPVWDGLGKWKEIMLTGGEPMVDPDALLDTVRAIRNNGHKTIYVYTAGNGNAYDLYSVFQEADGITLTLHRQSDVKHLHHFNMLLEYTGYGRIDRYGSQGKSLRLNIFRGIEVPENDKRGWIVMDDKVWLEDCPLPKGEVLMKLSKEI